MSGQQIAIDGPDGSFAGYLASPAAGRGPGIVVIQEIFGVNEAMRSVADELSATVSSRSSRICSGGWSRASSSPTKPMRNGSAPSTS